MRVHLGRIFIFPIKSLEGAVVAAARLTPGGILEHDRSYALVDAAGKYVNGKRDARVHRLRCAYDSSFQEVKIGVGSLDAGRQFVLREPQALNQWLSEYFDFAVELKHEPNHGFPDDREAFGPTVVSEASVSTVASWYPPLGLDSVRGRFRTNLELAGEEVPPFWEDRLFGTPGEPKPFQIGAVQLLAHNPCQRCVVPTRDPQSGEPIPGFQKEFMERRRQSLPVWANAVRFNHYYRFAVNTSVAASEAGKLLQTGDAVEVASTALAD
jgi:uncharacterized protein YcbX